MNRFPHDDENGFVRNSSLDEVFDSISNPIDAESYPEILAENTTVPASNHYNFRDIYTNSILGASSNSLKNREGSIVKRWARKCQCTPLLWLYSLFPILSWLPQYKWRDWLTFDLIAGSTICVMHIPQGMAYALLGNVQPVVGIYMAFFPVIVYSIMGTSRHVSMGTFAVICLMTGKVVTDRLASFSSDGSDLENNAIDNSTFYVTVPYGSPGAHILSSNDNNGLKHEIPTAEQISTVISFAVGIWQILMGAMRLGSLSVLLSAELVSGFTTGAAVHVLNSQIKNLFGLVIPRRNGIFKIPLSFYDICSNLPNSNVTAIIFSAITITCLVFYNELLKPLLNGKSPLPIPIELITIIIGTLVSKYWITSDAYGIPVVSHIPTGLPTPSIPPLELFWDVFLDSLVIAIVAYTISISMANIFAQKHDYSVSANQELIANGTSNFIGSFFSCAPIAASLSRSLIQEQVGGKTQLAGLFSCSIMVFVLLWIAPFFETLPLCVLSSMIVVALKGMFMQFSDLPKSLKESPLNAAVWVSTFMATTFLDIEYGLLVGLVVSILNLMWRSNRPFISVLGAHTKARNVYVDITYPQAKELPGIKIVKYIGSLNFATVDYFSGKLQRLVPHGITDTKGSNPTLSASARVSTISREKINDESSINDNLYSHRGFASNISWLIFDMSSVSSIDPAAVKILQSLHKCYLKKDIQILFIGCAAPVINIMYKCNFIKNVGIHSFFPSIHDAVIHCGNARAFPYTVDNVPSNLPENNNGTDYKESGGVANISA